MAYFLPSSIQKRLLRYALLRSGLLDAQELDLDSLDITLGRQNSIELRNVALHAQKISSLLKLPPDLRVQAASVSRLRLNVPADLFYGSITAEAQGVECTLALEDTAMTENYDERRPRSAESLRSPPHRKTHRRRRRSPPPEGDVLPNAQDLARSFLLDEPREEIHELEERYQSRSRYERDTPLPDAFDDQALGTGTTPGLPGFVAGFLQGIIDRAKLQIQDITAQLIVPFSVSKAQTRSHARGPGASVPRSVSIVVKVEAVVVGAAETIEAISGSVENAARRHIAVENIGLWLEGLEAPQSEPWSEMQTHPNDPPEPIGKASPSVAVSVQPQPSQVWKSDLKRSFDQITAVHANVPANDLPSSKSAELSTDLQRQPGEHPDPLEIQPGEENFTWNFRRSESGPLASDIWSDSDQPSDLEASVSADRYLSGSSQNLSTLSNESRTQVLEMGDPAVPMMVHDHPLFTESDTSVSRLPGPTIPILQSNSRTISQDPEPTQYGGDDVDQPGSMTESKFYDEDEDQSLYLSAHSAGFEQSIEDDNAEINLSSSSDSTDTVSAPSPTIQRTDVDLIPDLDRNNDIIDDSRPSNIPTCQHRMLFVDKINISISSGEPPHTESSMAGRPRNKSKDTQQMPGSFSVYADQSASVRFDDPNARSTASLAPESNESATLQSPLEISIGNVFMSFELGLLDEYLNLAKSLEAMTFPSEQSTERGEDEEVAQSKALLSCTVFVTGVRFDCVRSVERFWNSVMHDKPALPIAKHVSLACLQFGRVEFRQGSQDSSVDWALQIGIFRLFVGTREVLSFSDRLPELRWSTGKKNNITVEVTTSTTIGAQKVVHYTVQAGHLHAHFDLDEVAETFDSYGGLSGLLEIGSSFSVGDSISESPTTPVRKGVRFQDTVSTSSPRNSESRAEVKVNARIAGVIALVSSRSISTRLVTSSIKTVARPDFIAATIDFAQLTGPFVSGQQSIQQVNVAFKNVRAEYLFHPTDIDLERLLSLLTPSKNKYESDDDILLDTLLRQRRKGSVIRLTIGSLDSTIRDWTFLDPLQTFAEGLTSLSAVAKYLPEDERPGLLSLVHINEAQAKIPVNPTFGSATILLKDCSLAHIGLPSLVAFAINTIHIGRQRSFDLVHALMPISTNEDLPMIMARMIGDEVEPTLRLKLFNVCVEYSVPIFLALTEFGVDFVAEQVIDLAASTIADITSAAADLAISPSSTTSIATKTAKKLAVDVLFHQCVVALQPNGLISKALMVFDNAKITTMVPPKEVISVSCELRKATVYVADKIEEVETDGEISRTPLAPRLQLYLHNMGFVSVCSLMAARINVQVLSSADTSSKSVEIDVENELLLMETCADSTRTLITTLGALAPPSPPSKEPKFRTEPMSMDEMVASFTGDAFDKPASPPSTIFDTETTAFPNDDDLVDAQMSESMYGGVGDIEDPETDLMLEDDVPVETAESLLDEDPFEIPDNPNTVKLSNKDLAKDLARQLPFKQSEPSSITPWFLPSHQVDQFSGNSVVLGADYRFNTPNTKQRSIPDAQMQTTMPLKLRLKEVHAIWNLYDGYDWQGTRRAISQAVEEVEIRAEERRMRRQSANDPEDENSIIGDCLFNSIYIGVPAHKDAQDLRRQINRGIDDLASETESYATSGVSKPSHVTGAAPLQRGRRGPRRLKLQRSRAKKIAFELKGTCADILVFPPGSGEAQNSIDVRVREFDIFDNLPTSTWRKFLTSWQEDDGEREMAKPMIHLELTSIRPMLDLSATELLIRVTITPLRLHVDQDALDFITRFFEFKDNGVEHPPASDPPFIQRLEIHTVDLSLDYKPKRVDYAGLRSGRYTEFKNFFILDSAHIKLKHTILYGLKGFDTLNDTLNDIWMPDIKRNQLPGVLSGLAGVSPLVSLGAGIADVIAVPIREYRKDGRIVRSIQKGAAHLARNTTSEVARFGARVAVGTQNALLGAEGLLSATPAPSSRPSPYRQRSGGEQGGWTELDPDDDDEDKAARAVSAYANQPLGVMQGLRSARRFLERDLLTARDAIIAVQGEVLEGGSASAAAAAVARHAPTILLRPVIGATRAVGQTLMGVGNQVDRGNVRRIEDKYKQR